MSGMDFYGVSRPNERKYFDERKGCTFNCVCADCNEPQYQPEGVYTIYHGQKYLHNRLDKVVGVAHMQKGLVCIQCWYVEYPEEMVADRKLTWFPGGSEKRGVKSATARRTGRNRVAAKPAKTKRKSRAKAS